MKKERFVNENDRSIGSYWINFALSIKISKPDSASVGVVTSSSLFGP